MKNPLLTIFLVVFIDLFGFGIVIPILPFYAEEYGASGWSLGWLLASYSIAQFVMAPVWGKWSDRIGRRPILFMSIAGNGLGMIVLAMATDLTLLFIGRILSGICAANISTAYAYATDITTEKNRTKAMGLLGAAFGLGFTLGPAVGGILASKSFQLPMLVAAGLSFLNWIFGYFNLKEPERLQTKPKGSWSEIKKILLSPKSGTAIVTFFLFTFCITHLEALFALYMGHTFGFDAYSMGILIACVGMIMVVIQGGLVGRVASRVGETSLITWMLPLASVGLLLYSFATSLEMAIVALCLISAARGFLQPSLSSLASIGSAKDNRGITMGLFQSGSSLARAIGPVTAGFLYDFVNHRSPFLSAGILMAFAVVFFKLRLETPNSTGTSKR